MASSGRARRLAGRRPGGGDCEEASNVVRFDVIAGATIWALLVPEMIAYSGLAGLPPQAGVYLAHIDDLRRMKTREFLL